MLKIIRNKQRVLLFILSGMYSHKNKKYELYIVWMEFVESESQGLQSKSVKVRNAIPSKPPTCINTNANIHLNFFKTAKFYISFFHIYFIITYLVSIL